MIDNYEHYITKNIKAFYKRRLFSPIVYIILLTVLWFAFSLGDILSPIHIDDSVSFEAAYKDSDRYVKTTLKKLYFTGYTMKDGNDIKGYYYYCMRDKHCSIVLLAPSTCEEGLPSIDKLTVVGKIVKGKGTYTQFVNKLSKDLSWDSKGLSDTITGCYLNEPEYHLKTTIFMFVFYFGTFIYAVISLIFYILCIRFPVLAPVCQNLVVFGNPHTLLAEAEEELATLPQLATEDMFITEHYFIMTSPYGNAIVPIKEILWPQRLQYIKDAVEMLAERSNPTEQEVYAGRLAEETNISKTAILAQLGTAVKRAGGKYRREKNRELLRSGEMDQIKVPYSAGGSQALGIASAQQRLLAAILREPRYLELAKQQLTAEQFIQPQQKELYEAMLNCSREGVELSLTALRAFVSEEALNELSRLAAQYSDVNCTPDDIRLYLDRIARGMPVASKAAAMSGDEITQYLQSMREKKQGTLPEQD